MLKNSHGFATRLTGIALAASFAAGALLVTAGSPASAQAQSPAPDAKHEVHEVKKVILVGGRDGAPRHEIEVRQCEGEKVSVADEAGTDKEKKKMFITLCGKKGTSKAELAQMVEKAVTRIESSSDIDAATKARIVAQLRAKVSELRAN